MHEDELRSAVEDALRAPSVHNTQPWHWRFGNDVVRLYADRDRHLVATDPDARDLILSCGAALHHLRVSLAQRRVEARVDRLPDVDDRSLLATVTLCPGAGLPADPALAPAIALRRTDRRRMSRRPVPPALLRELAEHARRAGAVLLPTDRAALRDRLTAALVEAGRRQPQEPGYVTELDMWTRRYAGAHDGVAGSSIAPSSIGATAASPLRSFPGGRLAQPGLLTGGGATDDAAELLVITTSGDDELDRLRAGEATSAVLLDATRLGLATTPLSQGIEVDATRDAIRRDVLHVPEHPQLVVRVGWPATNAAPLPPTPRRPLRAVLLPD
jgi:nitroreductase